MAEATTLPGGHDQYFTHIKCKYFTGIVTSAATFSVGTAGITGSSVSYGIEYDPGTNPAKLPCDRTWKVTDDDGNTWFIPMFKYG